MSIESERAWLMMCIMLGQMANQASLAKLYGTGKRRTYDR